MEMSDISLSLAEDLKRISTVDLETVIAAAVSTLIGGQVECELRRLDFAGARFGIDLEMHLSRPLTSLSD
jgi:hypothetical protein